MIKNTIIAVLICIMLFFVGKSFNYFRDIQKQKGFRESVQSLLDSEISTTIIDMNLVGREVSFLDTLQLTNWKSKEIETLEMSSDGYGIFVVLSEVGCDLCIGEAFQIIKNIQLNNNLIDQYSFIVMGDNVTFLNRFIKYNRINDPIYVDPHSLVQSELEFQYEPVIILVDLSTKEIISALAPYSSGQYKNDLFVRQVQRITRT